MSLIRSRAARRTTIAVGAAVAVLTFAQPAFGQTRVWVREFASHGPGTPLP